MEISLQIQLKKIQCFSVCMDGTLNKSDLLKFVKCGLRVYSKPNDLPITLAGIVLRVND